MASRQWFLSNAVGPYSYQIYLAKFMTSSYIVFASQTQACSKPSERWVLNNYNEAAFNQVNEQRLMFSFTCIVNRHLLLTRRQNFDTMDATETRDENGPLNDSNSTANADIEMAEGCNPGAYIVPFAVDGQRGKRLDSVPASRRAWAANKLRSDNSWVRSRTFLFRGIANFFLSTKRLKRRTRDTKNGCSRRGNQENIPYLLVNMRVSDWMLYLTVFATGRSI